MSLIEKIADFFRGNGESSSHYGSVPTVPLIPAFKEMERREFEDNVRKYEKMFRNAKPEEVALFGDERCITWNQRAAMIWNPYGETAARYEATQRVLSSRNSRESYRK